MSEARIFNLVHAEARRRAAAYIVDDAPAGWRVSVKPQAKRRIQEERYHAMIGDIAQQWEFMGQKWHLEDMKRILVDAFAEAMREAGTPIHHDGRIIPSIDGRRVVQLGIQTSKFYVKEASDFIEYLFAFGAEKGIRWSDKAKAQATDEADA